MSPSGKRLNASKATDVRSASGEADVEEYGLSSSAAKAANAAQRNTRQTLPHGCRFFPIEFVCGSSKGFGIRSHGCHNRALKQLELDAFVFEQSLLPMQPAGKSAQPAA